MELRLPRPNAALLAWIAFDAVIWFIALAKIAG